MVKLELSYLNQESCCMLLMMLITMDAQQSPLPLMAKELFQEELKEKFEFGKLLNKRK